MYNIIVKLPMDYHQTIAIYDDVELFVYRPSKIPKKLINTYDVTKNFQIWIKENDREFKPNHLRILIDLNLRIRSRPELKRKLLNCFDNIFYGNDPLIEIENIKNEQFEHYLNHIEIIALLSQLFLIEQGYNYLGESKYEPKNLFLQGWIRQFLDSPKEIDNLCMSVARGQPPQIKYTEKENKKHRKFDNNVQPLWYLGIEKSNDLFVQEKLSIE